MEKKFLYMLEVIGCRTYQAVFNLGLYLVPYRMPEYIDGPGSISRLPELLKDKNVDNLLVVTDRTLMKLGLLNNMLRALDESGIRYTCFSDVGSNPTNLEVENGFQCYRENGCQAVLAFGGGSPMDCAKAICARVAHPNRSLAQMQGVFKVLKRVPTLIAVPTTSGTGSETTITAVISDSETNRKATMNDFCLIPKYAILDPELTMGLPPYITAITGMDALSHAVEAYTNETYTTKYEDDLAKKSVKLVYDNILTAYTDGNNLEARQNMQYAALFAGRAFTRGCVGYIHSIGHTLGSMYHVPHGLAMSVLMPHVMREFGPAVYKRMAELADVCGIEGADDAQKCNNFISWIEDTNRKMGIPNSFDMIRDEDMDQIVTWSRREANPLYPVPIVWGRDHFFRFIQKIRSK